MKNLKIFKQKTLRELRGPKALYQWLFSGILVISMMGLFTAESVLNYLHKETSDPFVNWMGIDIPWEWSDKVSMVNRELDTEDLRSHFHIQRFSNNIGYNLDINKKISAGSHRFRGVVMDSGDPLFEALLSPENLVWGGRLFSESDPGIIILEELHSVIQKSEDGLWTWIPVEIEVKGSGKDSLVSIPIPIRAVVRNLPERYQFVSSRALYSALELEQPHPLDPQEYSFPIFIFPASHHPSQASMLEVLKNQTILPQKEPTVLIEAYPYLSVPAVKCVIFPDVPPKNEPQKTDFVQGITRHWEELGFNLVVTSPVPWESIAQRDPGMGDQITVNFQQLDSVRSFRDHLRSEFPGMDLEDQELRMKESLRELAKATRVTTGSILIIGLAIGIIFVWFLLSKQLKTHQKSLGILLAEGLPSRQLKLLFQKIVFQFVGTAVLIGWGGAVVAGTVLLSIFPQLGFPALIWMLSFGLMILVLSFGICYLQLRRLTTKSPSDLIKYL